MKKTVISALSLLLCAGFLCACGSTQAPETTAAPEETLPALGIQEYHFSATTWSSPNGATIHLRAVPFGYDENREVSFLVCLEDAEVANVPCQWDGEAYTASAELNAADDLWYYLLMSDPEGDSATVPLNADVTFVDLASSLNAYCSLTVDAASASEGTLTIGGGTAFVQAPRITNEGQAITVSSAALVLSCRGEEKARQAITLTEANVPGGWEGSLSGTAFSIPKLAHDEALTLSLQAELSNGQRYSCEGGIFYYDDGQLLAAVG